MLRPIPNPAKPITTRKRKLQKSEILTSTPIKEDQKQKYEKNKVKNVTKRLNDMSKNIPKKTITNTDKDKNLLKRIKSQRKGKNLRIFYAFFAVKYILKKTVNQLKIGFDVTFVNNGVTKIVLLLMALKGILVIIANLNFLILWSS